MDTRYTLNSLLKSLGWGLPLVVAGLTGCGATEALEDVPEQEAPGLISSANTVYGSCQAIKTATPTAATGTYTIDPDGTGPLVAFQVRCDMGTGGGGWTLALTSSDDGVATWTWNNRLLLTSNTTPVGTLGQYIKDFKSRAHHELRFRDLLFIHRPSNIWAAYHNVGNGTASFASFISSLASPVCDLSLAGNGYPLSAGTLTLSGKLCDTDLYFNLGDFDGSGSVSYCQTVNGAQDTTFGPAWNMNYNQGCPFDDPGAVSMGFLNHSQFLDTEDTGRGFGLALGLNTGTAGAAQNRLEIYVR